MKRTLIHFVSLFAGAAGLATTAIAQEGNGQSFQEIISSQMVLACSIATDIRLIHLAREKDSSLHGVGLLFMAEVSERDDVVIILEGQELISIRGSDVVGIENSVPIIGRCDDVTDAMGTAIGAALGDDPIHSYVSDAFEANRAAQEAEIAALNATLGVATTRRGRCDTSIGSLSEIVNDALGDPQTGGLNTVGIYALLRMVHEAIDQADGACES